MLWEVRHDWPSGAQFSFNCYRHWSTLVTRADNGNGHFLHRKEGVNQGDPLAMVTYGLGIPPLIQNLQTAQPRVTQPWYTNDAGAGGNCADIRRHLDGLMVREPLWDTSRNRTRSSWSCLPGTSREQRLSFGDKDCR